MDIAQTLTLRAHILAEQGRVDEAVVQYRAVLRRFPDHIDAQDTLARLLPQIGRGSETFDSLDQAIEQRPQHLPLLMAAIRVAIDIQDHERALAFIDRAQPLLSDPNQLGVARIRALGLAGRQKEAIDVGQSLAVLDPVRVGLQANLAQLLLAQGDPKQALGHALLATQYAPLDQTGWALLTVIWRLLGDEREHWLADYDHYICERDIGTPDGWSDQSTFLADLRESLERLHVTTAHPADQTLRGGTQTRGDLFDRRSCPVIMALKQQLRRCVQSVLAELPVEAGHPFLSRRTGDIRFSGSWSVRLRESGHHVQHIHPQGWISSAFYVAVPDILPTDQHPNAGAILFGVPDEALNLNALLPRRVLQPQVGRLVLFPSYLWHGTAPFSGSQSRITVAFDALPA
ncbi:putative 2OG-Fe(II) oxygenase [Sphingobium sp. MK2]